MKNIYTVLMIVLPIFVGSLAIGDLILFFFGNEPNMNQFVNVGVAIAGMTTGIANILRLLK